MSSQPSASMSTPTSTSATPSSSQRPPSPPPSSPSPHRRLGYPDRTFETEILPCHPSSSITFRDDSSTASSSSNSSRHATLFPAGKEPFRKARPNIGSTLTNLSLTTAAHHLQRGQVVAFPTETVYGLGASALCQSASRKIYAAKKRPADNPLIVHVSDLEMLDTLLPDDYQLPPVYAVLMRQFWPGALTLLFPVSSTQPKVSAVVTCGQPSVAVRMPSHPIARALIALSGLPLAAPSANASGRPSPTTAAHVMRDLGGELDAEAGAATGRGSSASTPFGRLQYILDGGPSDVGLESTVVDGISTPGELRVLRPGGITVEQISSVLEQSNLLFTEDGTYQRTAANGRTDAVRLRVYGKDLARSAEQESNPTTPGMKYRHYSPTARVVMLLPSCLLAAAIEGGGNVASSSASTTAKQVVDALNVNPATTTATATVREAKTFSEIVESQLDKTGLLEKIKDDDDGSKKDPIRIGIMMTNDSDLSRWVHLTSCPCASHSASASDSGSVHAHLLAPLTLPSLAHVEIHPFDLGPTSQGETYAQRMFDGLRTLDEGPLRSHPKAKCELIFVEALHDGGVGLAVMNRLKKASSESVVVDC